MRTHDKLDWIDPKNEKKTIPYYNEDGSRNLTYDHDTSCVDMFNNGATVRDPKTGEVSREYPPGNNTTRAERNDFHDDPNNLKPMSQSDNSSKGGLGGYNDNPMGPNYRP